VKLIFLLLTKYNFAASQYHTQSVSYCVAIYIFTFYLLPSVYFTPWLSFIYFFTYFLLLSWHRHSSDWI